ncbi:carboxypeptidase-like regulatory domain-containing protein [Candidatus Ulvibacter alkanivorans]|uniref:carboxypeptidase-like regulatory domain-containing protein n=1 Tax=Candidatus Ulvibacter alkanivorans TaxID=2267620 RepID=UPI000DF1A89A|nr:carboxypeptidase-like regulatory domain-containing protein [Candidatus Ulvibacter alkanivorans]
MKKTRLLALLALPLIVASCGEHQIEGKVIDNFGKPVKDMKVAIKGTSLETTTNSNGEYGITFIPGTIEMEYTDERYMNVYKTYDIATETDYPAKTIETIRFPESYEANSLLVPKDGKYVSLPKSVQIYGERQESGNYSKHNNLVYTAIVKEDNLPTFQAGIIHIYFQELKNMTIVKISDTNELFRLGNFYYKNNLGKIYKGDMTLDGNAKPNTVSSKWTKFDNGDISKFMNGVWELELTPGRYAIVPKATERHKYYVNGMTFGFEVE